MWGRVAVRTRLTTNHFLLPHFDKIILKGKKMDYSNLHAVLAKECFATFREFYEVSNQTINPPEKDALEFIVSKSLHFHNRLRRRNLKAYHLFFSNIL